MRWWRWYLLVALGVTPFAILSLFGCIYLWNAGYGILTGWLLTGSLGLAYLLAWRWQRHQKLLRHPVDIPLAWTTRDKEAWKIVETRAKELSQKKLEELVSLPLYVDTAQTLAMDLARFYHPRAVDPISSLTVPEVLAVVELAAHDLSAMVEQYLPGGHLLTLKDFRRIKSLADWYPMVRDIGWIISTIFAPLNTATRYLTTQAGLNRPWQELQQNAVLWFFTAYVHRMGAYLIDLHSGRLRVGATRYLQLKKQLIDPSSPAPVENDKPSIKFVLLGQTNAGKSSLINALLGEQRAFVDMLPATPEAQVYSLQHTAIPTRLELIDTAGHGATGPTSKQLQATAEQCQQADVVLMVLHARHPARQIDLDQLSALRQYFAERPDLHLPPILAVVTHIDLLSPSLEWAPPYNWQQPSRPKEQQIAAAIDEVRAQFSTALSGIVPVCTATGKVYGIDEWLLPALMQLMKQGHAVAFLRCLKNEADRDKVGRVFHQLLAAGQGLLNIVLRPR